MKINKKKVVVPLLVLALVVTTIGGTLAWLMDKTDPVVNTFTVGNVNVTLQEKHPGSPSDVWKDTGREYKMVPGTTLDKEAKVTLDAGSEDAYVFVKVTKSANYDSFIESTMDPAWTKLSGTDDVYFLKTNQGRITAGTSQTILANNQVKVKDTLTNENMKNAKEVKPTITFKAYAIQADNVGNVNQAWAKLSAIAK